MGFVRFIILFCAIFVGKAHCIEQDPRSGHNFYTEAFGEVLAKEYPLSYRVSDVFTRLLRVSDSARGKPASVVLVNSESWPWAIALPDNTIVLTVGAVNLCYKGVSEGQGDVRLAMLLGHELAHLTEDDYWHRDVYLALTENHPDINNEVLQFIGKRSGLVKSSEWNEIVRDRELKADDKGAIYAVLAGFDIRSIFPKNKDSFFQFWVENTKTVEGGYYLTAAQRSGYLKSKLDSIVSLADAFKTGLVLMSMGYYNEAETLYTSILRRFPAQEVYNNLGYLKLAQSNVTTNQNSDNNVLFWLPIEVDINPTTPILSRGQEKSFVVNRNVREAIQYFELAVAKNPSYLTASLNLASAYFFAKRFNKASAVMEDAEKLNKAGPSVKMMQSLILFLNLRNKVNISQYVFDQIKIIIKDNPDFPMASYNLALLYDIDNKADLARPYWQSLAQNLDEIPAIYQKVIAKKLSAELPSIPDIDVRPLLWLIEEFMLDKQERSEARQLVPGDNKLTIVRQNKKVEHVTISGNTPLYSSIHIPEQKLKETLLKCCGKPTNKQTSIAGDLLMYQKGVSAFNSHSSDESELLLSQSIQNRILTQYETQ